jgi:hypothetical protein
MSRVPDDLSSLAEVWYLDGSSIYHNNNLGKKVLEKYNKKNYLRYGFLIVGNHDFSIIALVCILKGLSHEMELAFDDMYG